MIGTKLDRLRQQDSLPKAPQSDSLDDDQTISAKVPVHEPAKQAQRAAMKAAKLAKAGRHLSAVSEYEKALKLDPLFYQAGNNLALEYLNAKQLEPALTEWQQLTKQFPEHVLLFNNLAGVYYDLKLYAKAEAVAREALAIHPYSYKANLILGETLVAEGKLSPEAKKCLTFASTSRPEARELLSKWPPL